MKTKRERHYNNNTAKPQYCFSRHAIANWTGGHIMRERKYQTKADDKKLCECFISSIHAWLLYLRRTSLCFGNWKIKCKTYKSYSWHISWKKRYPSSVRNHLVVFTEQRQHIEVAMHTHLDEFSFFSSVLAFFSIKIGARPNKSFEQLN